MAQKRKIKSFGEFHREKLFVEKRRAELSNETDNTKKWKKMQEDSECGWSEFRDNDELMDTYIDYCTGNGKK
tara:strand:+ start:331 stop:546 length:216 start_codon:yes stop_codon:yes gene_type:complete